MNSLSEPSVSEIKGQISNAGTRGMTLAFQSLEEPSEHNGNYLQVDGQRGMWALF